jgi:hypothetical protein
MNARWGLPVIVVALAAAYPWLSQPRTESPALDSAASGRGKTSRSAPPPKQEQASPEQSIDGGPLKPLDEYWRVIDPDRGLDGEIAKITALAGRKHKSEIDIEFLIAIVPDPIDSRLAYWFDRAMDAIEDAIESNQWNLDHFWLPWYPSGQQPEAGKPLSSTPGPESDDAPASASPSQLGSRRTLLAKATARLRELNKKPNSLPLQVRKPGALLFRKPAGPGKKERLLMLLVVGETPTAGVHKRALFQCLEIVSAYATPPGADFPTRVNFRILGPFFSGSEQSLALTISRWIDGKLKLTTDVAGGAPALPKAAGHQDKQAIQPGENQQAPWQFRVITGGAMRIDKTRFQETARGGADAQRVNVEFAATIYSAQAMLDQLFKFLRMNRHESHGKFALLTESDTAFGNIGPESRGSDWPPMTRIKFPFHISQVALALDEERRKNDRTTPSLVRPSSRLTIPFDETGSPRDTVPALSPPMSTATSEFALGKIFETIAREDFRYIAIIATDTRDTLFLAGLIHQYCPDVQVIVPDGDLLLAHPRYSPELRGMILASTYPLFSMVQRWDPPYQGDSRRLLFSSQTDQAVYNATLFHLQAGGSSGDTPSEDGAHNLSTLYDSLIDYGRPFDELRNLGQFWLDHPNGLKNWSEQAEQSLPPEKRWSTPANQGERPPIWFSMVGPRGLWPLEFADKPDAPSSLRPDGGAQGAGSSGVRSDYPRGLSIDSNNAPRLQAADFIRRLVPLVPKFTWYWGGVFLILTAFAWLLIAVHAWSWCDGPRPAGSGLYRLEKLLGLYAGSGNRNPHIASVRDGYVFIGLLLLLGTYGLYVLWPCWILVSCSPWALFDRAELWPFLSVYEQWSWRFAAAVVALGPTTFGLILLTMAVRFFSPIKRAVATYRAKAGGPAPAPSGGAVIEWLDIRLLAALFAVLIVVLYRWLPWLCDLGLSTRAWDVINVVNQAGNQLLRFERAVSLDNGVSPLVPILLLTLVTGLWLACQLGRLYYAERFWETGGDRFQPGAGPAEDQLRFIEKLRERIMWLTVKVLPRTVKSLREVVPRPLVIFALAVLCFVLARLLHRMIPSVDFRGYTWAVLFWVWFLVVTVVFALIRFIWLWQAIVDLLRFFTSLPMLCAYDRVPPAFSRTFGRYLGQFSLRRIALAIPVQQWVAVARGFDELKPEICRAMYGKDFGLLAQSKQREFQRIERTLKGISGSAAYSGPCATTSVQAAANIQTKFFKDTVEAALAESDDIATCETWSGLRQAAIDCVHVLVPYWQSTPVVGQFEADGHALAASGSPADHADRPAASERDRASRSTHEELRVWMRGADDLVALRLVAGERDYASRSKDGELRAWMRNVEDLFALRAVAFISQGAIHLKNVATYLAVAPVLLLLAISSYPLEPQRFMVVMMWVVLLVVVVTGVTVVIQMERNEFLSRVSRTRPNKIALDPTFFTNILAFILPLLIATLAQFPFVSDTILQWLEPITRVLR